MGNVKVLLKRKNNGVATPAQLEQGELFIDPVSLALYSKNSLNKVHRINAGTRTPSIYMKEIYGGFSLELLSWWKLPIEVNWTDDEVGTISVEPSSIFEIKNVDNTFAGYAPHDGSTAEIVFKADADIMSEWFKGKAPTITITAVSANNFTTTTMYITAIRDLAGNFQSSRMSIATEGTHPQLKKIDDILTFADKAGLQEVEIKVKDATFSQKALILNKQYSSLKKITFTFMQDTVLTCDLSENPTGIKDMILIDTVTTNAQLEVVFRGSKLTLASDNDLVESCIKVRGGGASLRVLNEINITGKITNESFLFERNSNVYIQTKLTYNGETADIGVVVAKSGATVDMPYTTIYNKSGKNLTAPFIANDAGTSINSVWLLIEEGEYTHCAGVIQYGASSKFGTLAVSKITKHNGDTVKVDGTSKCEIYILTIDNISGGVTTKIECTGVMLSCIANSTLIIDQLTLGKCDVKGFMKCQTNSIINVGTLNTDKIVSLENRNGIDALDFSDIKIAYWFLKDDFETENTTNYNGLMEARCFSNITIGCMTESMSASGTAQGKFITTFTALKSVKGSRLVIKDTFEINAGRACYVKDDSSLQLQNTCGKHTKRVVKSTTKRMYISSGAVAHFSDLEMDFGGNDIVQMGALGTVLMKECKLDNYSNLSNNAIGSRMGLENCETNSGKSVTNGTFGEISTSGSQVGSFTGEN